MLYKTSMVIGKSAIGATAFGAKAFYKASMGLGKGVASIGKATGKMAKKAITTKGKSIINAVSKSSLAMGLTKVGIKVGWRAMKFAGKKLWSGIKKIASIGIQSTLKLFSIGKRLVNKVSTYVKRLS